MQLAVIGNGSWATALTKILTDNKNRINWWVRNEATLKHIEHRKHNPHYLSSVYFDISLLNLSTDVQHVIASSDIIVLAVPSAYLAGVLGELPKDTFAGKKIISAIKGILPAGNQLIHEYLARNWGVDEQDYFALIGPCHAEEVASERLSYLTFAGRDEAMSATMAGYFKTEYINTIINPDMVGVQYAAVLKNIYAVGAGIAHGLEYGDNFLSVYITNAAREMIEFSKTITLPEDDSDSIKYATSAYLGDLLVTCYSLHSRNRTFGNMIGKGYSVRAANLELNMVAEGYNACRSMFIANQQIQAHMPIATIIYEILWKHLPAGKGFKKIESILI